MTRENSKNKRQVLDSKYIYLYDASTLASMLTIIQDAIDKYGEDASISCDDEDNFIISYYREETDGEYNTRQARLKKQREKAQKTRKAQKENC